MAHRTSSSIWIGHGLQRHDIGRYAISDRYLNSISSCRQNRITTREGDLGLCPNLSTHTYLATKECLVSVFGTHERLLILAEPRRLLGVDVSLWARNKALLLLFPYHRTINSVRRRIPHRECVRHGPWDQTCVAGTAFGARKATDSARHHVGFNSSCLLDQRSCFIKHSSST